MGKNYKVLNAWFQKKDGTGQLYSSWCKKVSEDEVLCFVCNKRIACAAKGWAALTQHETTNCHKNAISIKLSQSQLLLKPRVSIQDSSPVIKPIELCHSREEAAKAELIWALKLVKGNIATSFADDTTKVFETMFGTIPTGFSLGRTKFSYLITEALGPHFRDELLLAARKSWEDFELAQEKKAVPQHTFLKHVSSRWLTAGPACERLLEQWEAVKEYFLVFVPNRDKKIMKSTKYKRITSTLKETGILVEANFVIESFDVFGKFVVLFQSSHPLVHEEQKKIKEQKEKEKLQKEDELKKEKEMSEKLENKKQSIDKLESKVKAVALEKKEVRESALCLLKEANKSLKDAISKNDLKAVRVAQGMLEGAEKLREQEKSHEEQEAKLNKIVNKRKKSIIDAFINKKPKLNP
ncbi:hypothetical protein JTE90_002566 [Oedothorax gibbosus]|uniref:Uncharacterized protein n=1 Tax=Oedothorax gibbosus TaxID=931172 RepID=A0AAV6TSS1_9ARAC|nr:hypothetical protein JTE90_002566 [Oedothorax gibbosus]